MVVAKVSGEVFVEGDRSQFFENYLTEDDLPMARDSLSELIGDGDAKVSVGLELKDKDMGSGFGAFVNVSLSCDQTEKNVQAAAGLAMELAEEFVADAFDAAKSAWKDKHKTETTRRRR